MKNTFLIVGLGNPGVRYKLTRHNIGYMVVDQIAKHFNCSFKRHFKYKIARFNLRHYKIILMKPTTYMNLSGKAVSKGIKKYNIILSNLLVISDDLNLPLGKIRLRAKGSAGGHNGLKSIIENLDTEMFPRLRIGMTGEDKISNVINYVLSPLDHKELAQVDQVINLGARCVEHFINHGLTTAMNEFNR